MSKEWDAVEWCAEYQRDALAAPGDSLRALAAEAERRGMLKAAEICMSDVYGEQFAAAIERAAKGEG